MSIYDGGRFIRDRREAVGLTQAQLAAGLHVSQSLVSLWEQGKAVPAGEKLRPLAEVLKVDLVELVDRQLDVGDAVERAIVKSPGLRSRREQDALLAAYGALTGRDSLGIGRMLRAGDGIDSAVGEPAAR